MQEGAATLADSDLVANVRTGDSSAETALYQKYSSRIYFLALSELRSKTEADDVRSETFLRLIQALRQDKLRSASSLPSFIVGIALNVIREHTRFSQKVQQFDGDEVNIAGEHSMEAAFLDDETKQTVKQIAGRLKPREQAFLKMYYYEELPEAEIARSLGLKTERLRLIKSRTLKSFRELYGRLRKD